MKNIVNINHLENETNTVLELIVVVEEKKIRFQRF